MAPQTWTKFATATASLSYSPALDRIMCAGIMAMTSRTKSAILAGFMKKPKALTIPAKTPAEQLSEASIRVVPQKVTHIPAADIRICAVGQRNSGSHTKPCTCQKQIRAPADLSTRAFKHRPQDSDTDTDASARVSRAQSSLAIKRPAAHPSRLSQALPKAGVQSQIPFSGISQNPATIMSTALTSRAPTGQAHLNC